MVARIIKYVLIALAVGVGAVLLWIGLLLLPVDKPQDVLYVRQMKREMIALSHDKAATNQRIADIKKDRDSRWTDGRVGITADGYVFYYDIHESHGMDSVRDIHLLYLPDEQRFLIAHDHWCVDLSKSEQAKNKAAVVKRF